MGLADGGPGAPICTRTQPGEGAVGAYQAETDRPGRPQLGRRLKALQYRYDTLGGFLAGTGLAPGRPNRP